MQVIDSGDRLESFFCTLAFVMFSNLEDQSVSLFSGMHIVLKWNYRKMFQRVFEGKKDKWDDA